MVRITRIGRFGLMLCLLLSVGRVAGAEVCDGGGTIDPAVARILDRVASRLDVQAPGAWTLSTANQFSQQYLLRPRLSERLSAEALAQYDHLFALLQAGDAEQLRADFAAAGFLGAVAPAIAKFDYILLNGSTAPSVRARIHALAEAIDSGAIQLKPSTKIVFLDGERPLFASETPAVLLDPSPYAKDPSWAAPKVLPTDERRMNEMLWTQMQLPAALRRQGILFVHAQKQEGAARAETADCVEAWVRRHHPSPGTALVVSNNPFVEYQQRVTQVLLAQCGTRKMEVHALGEPAPWDSVGPAVRVGLLLDALAGTLHRARQQEEMGLFLPQTPSK